MLRIEARNSQTPIERKPPWIKTRLRTGPQYTELRQLVRREGLHTVCEEAGCPNIFECWEDREATFLIGGDQCTRRCDFCQIATGKPGPLDTDEPRRVAESVATMGLRYATVTGVARDDLADGGAWLYAQTCAAIHDAVPGCGVELLIPDFNAEPALLAEVFAARPEVLAHNIETVPRIFRQIRPGFRYERSLDVLSAAKAAGLITKSNLILGMGEERPEVTAAMRDLRSAGCDLLTITQYLRPVAQASSRSTAGSPRTSSASWAMRRWRSGSPASCQARWSARPTGPAGCTGPRSTAAGQPGGRGQEHDRVSRSGPHARILTCMVKKPGGAAAQASNKAAKNAPADPASAGRLRQIGMVAGIIRKSDPKALPIVIGSGVAVLARARRRRPADRPRPPC